MLPYQLIVDPAAAEEYFTKNDLTAEPFANVEAILLQHNATAEGLPAAVLVMTIDGKKRIAKITLRALVAVAGALNARAERDLGLNWRGP